MNEKDVLLVKKVVKETIYEILETEVYNRLFDFLDSVEAGIAGLKQQMAKQKGVVETPTAVKEETFTCLKFEPMKGVKIGEYEVAYKEQNLPEHWNSAFNVLKQSNATIAKRYHGEGYQYTYWLYGEGKIYRQKLNLKHP